MDASVRCPPSPSMHWSSLIPASCSVFCFLFFVWLCAWRALQAKGMSLMKGSERIAPSAPKVPRMNPLSRTLFAVFGGRKKHSNKHTFDKEGAKKVNPKVFFANERTFLKWMNVSVWVAGISIGISSIVGSSARYSGWESWSSLVFLAMAIVMSCYSMIQCKCGTVR